MNIWHDINSPIISTHALVVMTRHGFCLKMEYDEDKNIFRGEGVEIDPSNVLKWCYFCELVKSSMPSVVKNFKYNDIVLYAKHWYKHGDILDDLSYLFGKIFAYPPNGEVEIASMMLRVIDELYIEKGERFSKDTFLGFRSLYDEAHKYMYFFKCSFDMAIIRVTLTILSNLTKDEIILKRPHYGKKEHFRMGNMVKDYPISMTYAEMNRIAKKTF